MVARWVLESIGQHLWGFKPRLMAHIVEQHGGLAALRWFAGNMPRYERLLKNWGPVRTHIISVTTSLINGCAYCSFGHAYSFQLHYLKNTGKLFPLTDEQMLRLGSQPPSEIVGQLCNSLQQAGLAEEIPFVTRTAELMQLTDYHSDKKTHSPTTEDDDNITHLINMFRMLNSCGIRANAEPDEAHDPINKNRALIENYHRKRSAAASQKI